MRNLQPLTDAQHRLIRLLARLEARRRVHEARDRQQPEQQRAQQKRET